MKTTFNSSDNQDYSHELMKLVIVDDGSSDSILSLLVEFTQETDIDRTMIYRAANLKKVFAFSIIRSLSMIAQSLGFARAHLNGYRYV